MESLTDSGEVVDFEVFAEVFAVFQCQEFVDLAVVWLLEETEVATDFLGFRDSVATVAKFASFSVSIWFVSSLSSKVILKFLFFSRKLPVLSE